MKPSKQKSSTWWQLNRSGFCFRIIDGKCTQAAALTFTHDDLTPSWKLFNPVVGHEWWARKKELFHRPPEEWLEVLDTLPFYDEDDHRFMLEIIAE
jgi:hypothetical protein